jgi:PBSX family phage terminase large subunit
MQITIAFKPNSIHQKAFLSSMSPERLLVAGFGSGKTLVGAAEHIKLATLNPKLESLIVVANIPIARKTVIPVMQKMLEESKIEYSYHKNNFTFYLPQFKHTIFIQSAEYADNLKGSNVTHVWFDELAIMDREAYIQGIARAREPKAYKYPRVFATTTPEGLNWVYEEFVQKKIEGREIVYGKTLDNPALPKTYIKQLENRYTEEQRKMYLGGEFVANREGLVIPEWNEAFRIAQLPEDPFYEYYQRYVSMDLGVTDKTAILFGTYYYRTAKLVVEDEIIMQGNEMTTLKIAEYVRHKEEKLWGVHCNVRRYADTNNLMLLQDLSLLHDMTVIGTSKDTLEAMINQARLWVGAGRVLALDKCEELTNSLPLVKWNPNKHRADIQRSQSYGHGDALMALVYMIRNIDTSTNPIPAPQYSMYDYFVYKQENKKYQELENLFYEE